MRTAILIAMAVGAVAAFFAIAYFVITFFSLWLQSLLTNAGVGIGDLAGMYCRRQRGKPHHYRLMARSRIAAVQAGLPVTLAELEAHYLAGGDVSKVLHALMTAHRQHVPLSFAAAAALELAGRDPLQALAAPPAKDQTHP